ncbi:MAG: RNA 2',3'-cyclic phosphodiesterase [Phycisphaerae bacterium]
MRLFVAIEFSDRVRSVLERAQTALRRKCEGVRWVRPEQLHLTAKFLGEVRDATVSIVGEAVARAAQRSGSFTMTVSGCGCFPQRGPVRIVWAGLTEQTGALTHCVDKVEEELEKEGFARERRAFSPHVTIGRVREDRSRGAIRSAAEGFALGPVEQSVSSITLMSSVLSSAGPTYTALRTIELT